MIRIWALRYAIARLLADDLGLSVNQWSYVYESYQLRGMRNETILVHESVQRASPAVYLEMWTTIKCRTMRVYEVKG